MEKVSVNFSTMFSPIRLSLAKPLESTSLETPTCSNNGTQKRSRDEIEIVQGGAEDCEEDEDSNNLDHEMERESVESVKSFSFCECTNLKSIPHGP